MSSKLIEVFDKFRLCLVEIKKRVKSGDKIISNRIV